MIRFCPLSPLVDLSICQILLSNLSNDNKSNRYQQSSSYNLHYQHFLRLYMLYFLLDQHIIKLDDQFENVLALASITRSYEGFQYLEGSLLFFASLPFIGHESIETAVIELFTNAFIMENLHDIVSMKDASQVDIGFQVDMKWAAIANASKISNILSLRYSLISIQRANLLFELFLDVITSSSQVPKRKQNSVLWQFQCAMNALHTIIQVSDEIIFRALLCSGIFYGILFYGFEIRI